jgi:hypothetical protein
MAAPYKLTLLYRISLYIRCGPQLAPIYQESPATCTAAMHQCCCLPCTAALYAHVWSSVYQNSSYRNPPECFLYSANYVLTGDQGSVLERSRNPFLATGGSVSHGFYGGRGRRFWS